MEADFVKNGLIIAVILSVVFLSQQPYFREFGRNSYTWVKTQADDYLGKANNYAKETLLPKIDGEVEQKKGLIADEISRQKEKISESVSESVGEKIKNYFSGISNAILHPSDGKTDSSADSAANASADCNCVCPPASSPYLP